MKSRSRGYLHSDRSGFTFAELLLVVAVLLVISGLVFPPVMRLMADQPLKESAERARSQLTNVRVKALDSSVAWQFRFEPGGRHYLWMPLEPASLNATTVNSLNSSTTATTNNSATPQFGELPKGVNFSSDLDGIPFSSAPLSPELLAGAANAYQLQQVVWSQPLAFQPDGTTSDFHLAVVDARNRQIRLSLRGLTGGVTVTSIETRRP